MGNFIELESDKDKRSRKRIKDCNELVGELMRMLLDGDDRYQAAVRLFLSFYNLYFEKKERKKSKLIHANPTPTTT
ncbi:hypothetical protein ERO13_D03G164560v2 [Gossypium hirsutum]|nr:hypothetical protein ERO13_D03G164560v2 [Gossypium hirsutum]